ncbi:LPXTG cell wall anchor domain-containing protein [Secundilactobacillus collinoides]|uniref:LPXTG cell wall anchor domain-containing protein n=1 Tax=Secundilactobacillus collinoides TaxID=33960 RepID=UPI0006D25E4F|nr:LPXTG cell wall anchor domain-containing protein [Secundilactobacillus collinoides]
MVSALFLQKNKTQAAPVKYTVVYTKDNKPVKPVKPFNTMGSNAHLNYKASVNTVVSNKSTKENKSVNNTLPQTGEQESNNLSIAGIIAMIL